MNESLKQGLLPYTGQIFTTIAPLFKIIKDIYVANFREFANSLDYKELFLMARNAGWFTEDKRGNLKVDI